MPTYKARLDSKLPHAGTSIFAVMSKLALENGAINLSQGYPDFPTSPRLIELVHKAMITGHNQYAPMPGIFSLRETIAEKLDRLYGTHYDPDTEITVTAGATQAIFTAIAATVRKDDEVILFAPAYDSYAPSIEANGGIPVEIEMELPSFTIDWQKVKQSINERTRMILINTPHNPTGSVLSDQDMQQLRDLTANSSIIILSDEVYEHMIYDGQKHNSVARYPDLADRSFLVASFGKTFHNTGWKMGYCAAPHELMKEFRKIHQFNVFSVNHPMQKAISIYLKDPENYEYLPGFFEAKRNVFLEALEGSRFSFIPSKGTYFQLLGYQEISDEGDMELASRMTREHKVASIPVSAFYQNKTDNKFLRFCFAKSEETLLRGAEILRTL
ncbi:MAG: methionine aminotransferase [Lutimonas sp.]